MKKQYSFTRLHNKRLLICALIIIIGLIIWYILLSYAAKTPSWNGQNGLLEALYLAPVYLILLAGISTSLLFLVSDLFAMSTHNLKWANKKISTPYLIIILIIAILLLVIAVRSAVVYVEHYNNFIKLY
jgi:hypothetical protein